MATVLLCGVSRPRAAQLAAALAPDWATSVAPLPPARLATRTATAASARVARRLDAIDSVIIWPTLAARRGARNPGPRAWRAAIDAHLRGAYLVARAAGLAFAARGGGRLLVVIDAPPADELIANVVAEGLICLADGLRKALGAAVDVASLQLAPGRGDRHAAAHVRAWLAAPPGVFNVTVGAPSRSRSPAASARRG